MKEIIVTLIALAIAISLRPLIVMLLWNAVVPTIFGLIAITYKQSFYLCLLAWFLFGKSIKVNKD